MCCHLHNQHFCATARQVTPAVFWGFILMVCATLLSFKYWSNQSCKRVTLSYSTHKGIHSSPVFTNRFRASTDYRYWPFSTVSYQLQWNSFGQWFSRLVPESWSDAKCACIGGTFAGTWNYDILLTTKHKAITIYTNAAERLVVSSSPPPPPPSKDSVNDLLNPLGGVARTSKWQPSRVKNPDLLKASSSAPGVGRKRALSASHDAGNSSFLAIWRILFALIRMTLL